MQLCVYFLIQICQETAARDGLMKMKQVYESNPALGDPMSIQGQLTDNGQRLDKLRAEQKKFQVKLHESESILIAQYFALDSCTHFLLTCLYLVLGNT